MKQKLEKLNLTHPKPTLLEDLGMMFPNEDSKHKVRFGIYKCGLCGTEFKSILDSVKRGKTKSCGCYNSIKSKERFTKHNLSDTKIYLTWKGIKTRTLNPKNKRYSDYGGRGITVCKEWRNDFKTFYNWAMSNGYSDELSLDRIDNNGNYEPNNCRWTTQTIQCRNQRIYKNNSSGYKGVFYIKNKAKYQSYIGVNKNRTYLGLYPTAEDGAIAYNNYIIENNLEGFPLNKLPDSHTHLQLPTKPHHQTLK